MKFAGAWVCLAMGATVCVAEEDISGEPSAGEREGDPLARRQPSAPGARGCPSQEKAREGAPFASNMPPEWFAPPKTASELGITQFSQSPILDGQDLPPLEDRLPDDPVVSHPYERIGKYGGKARVTLWDHRRFFPHEHALTISADLRNVLPNIAESWSVSEDGHVTTIRLRPGIKWSDGVPLTSSDFMFSFNHDWLDPEMQPLTNVAVRGASFVVIDDLTFQIVFPRPNPTFVNYYAFYASRWVDPMHFFKDYHPAYRDRDELNALVKEKGHVTWMAMFNQLRSWGHADAWKVPTLRAFKVVERTPTKMRMERNPYYFKGRSRGQPVAVRRRGGRHHPARELADDHVPGRHRPTRLHLLHARNPEHTAAQARREEGRQQGAHLAPPARRRRGHTAELQLRRSQVPGTGVGQGANGALSARSPTRSTATR